MANPPKKPTMSMEAYLDEERLEVLALLGSGAGRGQGSASSANGRSASPFMTTRSPVRSMLDFGDDPKSTPRPPPVRSMLDFGNDVASSSSQALVSGPNSPASEHTPTLGPKSHHPRSFSDAGSARPLDSTVRTGLPKVTEYQVTDPYQFGLMASPSMPVAAKRNAQGVRRNTGGLTAEGQARANELGIVDDDRGRPFSKGSSIMSGSRSPHPRSRSPFGRSSGGNLSSNVVLDNGTVINKNNAYRHLSDANIAISGGSLSRLAQWRRADDLTGRLTKDWTEDGDEEDSSDDDPSTSDDEQRGRGNTSRGGAVQRQPQSLLGAAEEERLQVSSASSSFKQQYKSLFEEPEITLTNPSGEKKAPKIEIHPSTSFEPGLGSGNASGADSDDVADVDDIHRAQKLSFSMTPIMARPDAHRAIRIIYRGEYHKIVKAAEDEHRRLRKYMVATDLSEESTHALEWTIGTVLRDGDTLICIYCVDEETGIGASTEGQVPDEPAAMKEVAFAINSMATTKAPPTSTTMVPFPQLTRAQPLHAVSDRVESPAATSRERSRAEDERVRAIRAITEKVVKLLRKTRLQVRVTVEVLHCKNPKHLITEVIDTTSPTLVILGSRGRSALKGVILGSFSNYLVTKSSAPVMVARKRLRKTKYKSTKPHTQVNNLSGPAARKLANAKVD